MSFRSRRSIFSAVLLFALTCAQPVRAQLAERRDSSVFDARELIVPGVLMTSGVAIHCFAHECIDVAVQKSAQEWRARSGPVPYYEYTFRYIPALPLVMDAGLGLVGVPARNGFLDRGIEATLATGIAGGTALLLKNLIDAPRPDGTNNNSFPSGHCSIAFVGAELVRMEYGWGWGAGAYAVAATVAVLRSYHNRHYLSDLLMGAGIGILSAHAGRWLLEPTRNLLGFPASGPGSGRGTQISFAPSVDPVSGTICAGLAMNF